MSNSTKKFEVLSSCGRNCLFINGIVLAMEGDPCRDADIIAYHTDREIQEIQHKGWCSYRWNKERLERAATILNKIFEAGQL